MTTSAAGRPLIPQPPSTVTALRQAVAQVSPAALPAFTRELDEAADQARQGSDLAPLQRFIAQWAAYVHIQRQPQLAEDLRRWERVAATGTAEEAFKAASEIGKILDATHAALDAARR
ncbi:DUF6247 family protein [Streptomyces sp. NPDC007369]|uniref:DUF6247 family protein n=1 Tax=Streptomyces sp. NPDC007369 TaxID=3154589 RepID=UPI0033D1A69F